MYAFKFSKLLDTLIFGYKKFSEDLQSMTSNSFGYLDNYTQLLFNCILNFIAYSTIRCLDNWIHPYFYEWKIIVYHVLAQRSK